jgi:hypothetical protein
MELVLRYIGRSNRTTTLLWLFFCSAMITHLVYIAYSKSKTGPIAVGLNGGADSFLSYSGGIYSNPTCKHGANHAMLVVGYGQETDSRTGHATKYWIARNSWGKGWVGIQILMTLRLSLFISFGCIWPSRKYSIL